MMMVMTMLMRKAMVEIQYASLLKMALEDDEGVRTQEALLAKHTLYHRPQDPLAFLVHSVDLDRSEAQRRIEALVHLRVSGVLMDLGSVVTQSSRLDHRQSSGEALNVLIVSGTCQNKVIGVKGVEEEW